METFKVQNHAHFCGYCGDDWICTSEDCAGITPGEIMKQCPDCYLLMIATRSEESI